MKVPDLDFSLDLERPDVGTIQNLRLSLENAVDSPHRGGAPFKYVHHVAEGNGWPGQHGQVGHEGDQFTDSEATLHDAQAPQPEKHDRGKPQQQSQEGIEETP